MVLNPYELERVGKKTFLLYSNLTHYNNFYFRLSAFSSNKTLCNASEKSDSRLRSLEPLAKENVERLQLTFEDIVDF